MVMDLKITIGNANSSSITLHHNSYNHLNHHLSLLIILTSQLLAIPSNTFLNLVHLNLSFNSRILIHLHNPSNFLLLTYNLSNNLSNSNLATFIILLLNTFLQLNDNDSMVPPTTDTIQVNIIHHRHNHHNLNSSLLPHHLKTWEFLPVLSMVPVVVEYLAILLWEATGEVPLAAVEVFLAVELVVEGQVQCPATEVA